MVPEEEKDRLRTLLKETITLLCKNGLHQYSANLCIDALIGITLGANDVMLVSIKEMVRPGEDNNFDVQEVEVPSPHHDMRRKSVKPTDDPESPSQSAGKLAKGRGCGKRSQAIPSRKARRSKTRAIGTISVVAEDLQREDSFTGASTSTAAVEASEAESWRYSNLLQAFGDQTPPLQSPSIMRWVLAEDGIGVVAPSKSVLAAALIAPVKPCHGPMVQIETDEDPQPPFKIAKIEGSVMMPSEPTVNHLRDASPAESSDANVKQEKMYDEDRYGHMPSSQMEQHQMGPSEQRPDGWKDTSSILRQQLLTRPEVMATVEAPNDKAYRGGLASMNSLMKRASCSPPKKTEKAVFKPKPMDQDKLTKRVLKVKRMVLLNRGPYSTVRMICRQMPYIRAGLILETMREMVQPKDSDDFIGELRDIKMKTSKPGGKATSVFYKCPPSTISPSALATYDINQGTYTELFYGSYKYDRTPQKAYFLDLLYNSPFRDHYPGLDPTVLGGTAEDNGSTILSADDINLMMWGAGPSKEPQTKTGRPKQVPSRSKSASASLSSDGDDSFVKLKPLMPANSRYRRGDNRSKAKAPSESPEVASSSMGTEPINKSYKSPHSHKGARPHYATTVKQEPAGTSYEQQYNPDEDGDTKSSYDQQEDSSHQNSKEEI